MKLFVFGATGEAEARKAWDELAGAVEGTFGWGIAPRKIHALTYRRGGSERTLTVGAVHPDNLQKVVAILEASVPATPYLVLTQTRGAERGVPFMVGKEEAASVEEFE